jgi:hypothetical protein
MLPRGAQLYKNLPIAVPLQAPPSSGCQAKRIIGWIEVFIDKACSIYGYTLGVLIIDYG